MASAGRLQDLKIENVEGSNAMLWSASCKRIRKPQSR